MFLCVTVELLKANFITAFCYVSYTSCLHVCCFVIGCILIMIGMKYHFTINMIRGVIFFKNFMKVVGQTMPHTYISVNTIQVAICTGMQRILIIYTLCKWSMPAKSVSFAASIFDDRNILRSPVCVYDFMLGDAIAAFISSFMMYTEQKCKLLQSMIKKDPRT